MSTQTPLLSSAVHVGEHVAAMGFAGALDLFCLPTLKSAVEKIHHLPTDQTLALGLAIFVAGWVTAYLSLRTLKRRHQERRTTPIQVVHSPAPPVMTGARPPRADEQLTLILVAPASHFEAAARSAAVMIASARCLPPPG